MPSGAAGLDAGAWLSEWVSQNNFATGLTSLAGRDQDSVTDHYRNQFFDTQTGSSEGIWAQLADFFRDKWDFLADVFDLADRVSTDLGIIIKVFFNLGDQQAWDDAWNALFNLFGWDNAQAFWDYLFSLVQPTLIDIGRLFKGDYGLIADGGFKLPPPEDVSDGEWFWTHDKGRTSAGCAGLTGDGQDHELIGRPVPVNAGGDFTYSAYISYEDVAITADTEPIQIKLIEFDASHNQVDEVVLGSAAPSGDSLVWLKITGDDHTIPDGVVLATPVLYATSDFLSGTVYVDDATNDTLGHILLDWIVGPAGSTLRDLFDLFTQMGPLLGSTGTTQGDWEDWFKSLFGELGFDGVTSQTIAGWIGDLWFAIVNPIKLVLDSFLHIGDLLATESTQADWEDWFKGLFSAIGFDSDLAQTVASWIADLWFGIVHPILVWWTTLADQVADALTLIFAPGTQSQWNAWWVTTGEWLGLGSSGAQWIADLVTGTWFGVFQPVVDWISRLIQDLFILIDLFHLVYKKGSSDDAPGTLGSNGLPTWWSAFNDLLALFGLVTSPPPAGIEPPDVDGTVAAAQATANTANTNATAASAAAADAQDSADSALGAATAATDWTSAASAGTIPVIAQSSIIVDPTPAAGAVTFDAVGDGATVDSGTSASWGHTVGAGANYLVVFIAASADFGALSIYQFPTSVQFSSGASVQLSELGRQTYPTSAQVGVVVMGGPVGGHSGAATLTVTPSGGGHRLNMVCNSASYSGVGILAFSGASGQTSSGDQTVLSGAGHIVAQAFVGNGSITGYNQTELFTDELSVLGLAQGDAAGASSVTFSATMPTASFAAAALDMRPIGAVIGSYARAFRSSATATASISSGAKQLPSGTMDTTASKSDDITIVNGNSFTITYSGSYGIEFCVKRSSTSTTQVATPLLYINGTLAKVGQDCWLANSGQTHFTGFFTVNLSQGDTVTPGFSMGNSWTISGGADATDTYMEIALLNRSYQ